MDADDFPGLRKNPRLLGDALRAHFQILIAQRGEIGGNFLLIDEAAVPGLPSAHEEASFARTWREGIALKIAQVVQLPAGRMLDGHESLGQNGLAEQIVMTVVDLQDAGRRGCRPSRQQLGLVGPAERPDDEVVDFSQIVSGGLKQTQLRHQVEGEVVIVILGADGHENGAPALDPLEFGQPPFAERGMQSRAPRDRRKNREEESFFGVIEAK